VRLDLVACGGVGHGGLGVGGNVGSGEAEVGDVLGVAVDRADPLGAAETVDRALGAGGDDHLGALVVDRGDRPAGLGGHGGLKIGCLDGELPSGGGQKNG